MVEHRRGAVMTVAAPPRPPRPSDPVEHERPDPEALIEEARERARRRGRKYTALATLVAVAGVATAAGSGAKRRSARPATSEVLS